MRQALGLAVVGFVLASQNCFKISLLAEVGKYTARNKAAEFWYPDLFGVAHAAPLIVEVGFERGERTAIAGFPRLASQSIKVKPLSSIRGVEKDERIIQLVVEGKSDSRPLVLPESLQNLGDSGGWQGVTEFVISGDRAVVFLDAARLRQGKPIIKGISPAFFPVGRKYGTIELVDALRRISSLQPTATDAELSKAATSTKNLIVKRALQDQLVLRSLEEKIVREDCLDMITDVFVNQDEPASRRLWMANMAERAILKGNGRTASVLGKFTEVYLATEEHRGIRRAALKVVARADVLPKEVRQNVKFKAALKQPLPPSDYPLEDWAGWPLYILEEQNSEDELRTKLLHVLSQ